MLQTHAASAGLICKLSQHLYNSLMIILFNKPFDVLCQFTDEQGRKTLADFIKQKNVYAAGRLDRDSEGLVVLTDDGKLQNRITEPKNKMPKTYWAQVEGKVTRDAITQLKAGITIKDGKNSTIRTKPAKAKIISEPEILWSREPPIRQRKNIPTSWIELIITEGRNRQVRRMTAATGFPTLRLIRYGIGKWSIDNIKNGDYVVAKNNAFINT